MKSLFILILVTLVFNNGNTNAQTPGNNLKKYWYYRTRLINDFMLVGEGPGKSMPASIRDFYNWNTEEPHQLTWGDGTIDLGWYIGVLATEYKLLKDNSQDVSGNIRELYYALEAFNRLDYYAEQHWGGTPSLNGFFIRSDQPLDFVPANYNHFNSGKFSSRIAEGTDPDLNWTNKYTEETHDQIWHLMIGLSLVNKCVDEYANYGRAFIDGESSILREAHNITDRIFKHLLQHNWTVKNPILDKCTIGIICQESDRTDNCELNSACGSNVIPFCYGAAEVACRATGKFVSGNQIPPLSCPDYHNVTSQLNFPLWQLYGSGVGNLLAIDGEDHKIQLIAALGNSWYTQPFAAIPGFFVNTTAAKLYIRSMLRHFQHLPLLRQVLHGGINLISKNFYVDLMNSAPCGGPYNFGYPHNSATYEWSSTNRLKNPTRRGEKDDGEDRIEGFYGEYNGLDYMLLHNLYYLIEGADLPAYINYMDYSFSDNFPKHFPVLGITIGNDANPLHIGAFNSITYNGTLNSDANVTFHAGTEINYLSDFEAKPGAEHEGIIAPFRCVNNGYQRTAGEDTDTLLYGFDILHMPNNFVPLQHQQENIVLLDSLQQNNVEDSLTLSANKSFSLHPNPNNGTFTLTLPDANAQHEVVIYDLLGNVIYHSKTIDNQRIDISTQPKGVYFVKVSSGNQVWVRKVVHQ